MVGQTTTMGHKMALGSLGHRGTGNWTTQNLLILSILQTVDIDQKASREKRVEHDAFVNILVPRGRS